MLRPTSARLSRGREVGGTANRIGGAVKGVGGASVDSLGGAFVKTVGGASLKKVGGASVPWELQSSPSLVTELPLLRLHSLVDRDSTATPSTD